MTDAPRTIALFGGSFNPPHVAHQLSALWVLETRAVDELWFAPVFSHVFSKPLADFEHRVAMCELAIAPLGPRARVCRAEAELAQHAGFVGSRTLDLIDHLERTHPGAHFRLTIGADIRSVVPVGGGGAPSATHHHRAAGVQWRHRREHAAGVVDAHSRADRTDAHDSRSGVHG
jgi:hypothetical protein